MWLAIWWMTEAINISVTAMFPLALFPLLGIAGMHDAAAPYAHLLVFLFMGGVGVVQAAVIGPLGSRTGLCSDERSSSAASRPNEKKWRTVPHDSALF